MVSIFFCNFINSSVRAKRILNPPPSCQQQYSHFILLFLNMLKSAVGESGMGAYHGVTGFDRLSHLKPILRKWTIIDPALRSESVNLQHEWDVNSKFKKLLFIFRAYFSIVIKKMLDLFNWRQRWEITKIKIGFRICQMEL
jgi:hypothetical protein